MTTTVPHSGLDEIDARRLLAITLAGFLEELDALAGGASADTWSVENALNNAEDVLAEHADDMPSTAFEDIEHAIVRIGDALAWGLDVTIPGTGHAFADGLAAADDIIARLVAHRYHIARWNP